MKISFPLSIKVTVWLLLNLLLLAVAAVIFLVSQGGLSWDSLVAGASGNRIHALAEVIAGETAAVPDDKRDAVLARFSAAYHADFELLRGRGGHIAGASRPLPPSVRERLDFGPPGPRGLGLGRGNRSTGETPDEPMPPRTGGPGGPGAPHGDGRGRFLRHDGDPASWWIGLRVPFHEASGRLTPATLLIRTDSLWNVVLLLNLETWLLGAATVLAMSILFWLPLVHSITRDLRALTAATERIAEGRFDTRVATNRRDELGRLGESVNSMAGRLDTLVNGQKRFLADVAHELGSPLARLQVATELIERRADGKLGESLKDVREEVEQLAALVNELLMFTRTGLRAREVSLAPVNAVALVSRIVQREDKAHRIQIAVPPDVQVLADEALLERAVSNLVRNALRYAGDSAPIMIFAAGDSQGATISVEDEGPGVPPDALARLGEPFYRPEAARTRETGGVGLGLAIVRTSVAACGGEVLFSNRAPHGFRAEIRLQSAKVE